MKKYLFLLLMIPFFCSSQTEFIFIEGHTQEDIDQAISDIEDPNIPDTNGYGIISIKGDVLINDDLEIPSNITLNFYTGNKLIVAEDIKLNIKGKIKSTATQIFETGQQGHEIRILNQEVYPEWFGPFFHQTDRNHAVASNETIKKNEYKTIQKAVNALVPGGEIVFEGSEYLIYKPIDIKTRFIKVTGKGKYSAGGTNANDMIVGAPDVSSIFNIQEVGVSFFDLNFVGYRVIKNNKYALPDCMDLDYSDSEFPKGVCSKGKALNFVRLPNDNGDIDKNIDGEISNCRFIDFKTCVYAEGINLKIIDNFFGACHTGISITNVQGENDEILDGNKETRGFIIDRNRFHSIGASYKDDLYPSIKGATCIKIRNNYANNLVSGSFRTIGYYNNITNNYSDDCKTFFEGNIDRTKITNNSIYSSADTAIKAFGGYKGVISNNLIDGAFTKNPLQRYPLEPNAKSLHTGHGIHVDYAHYTTIHDNQISNKRFHGIYIEHSKHSSIQSNFITDFNRFWKVSVQPNGVFTRFDGNSNNEQIGLYDGIHIKKTEGERYNIQNIVTNNVISIPNVEVRGRYGIYAGDGDDFNFIKNNFILTNRLAQTIRVE
jgi:parallel beta-helix repeat protein